MLKYSLFQKFKQSTQNTSNYGVIMKNYTKFKLLTAIVLGTASIHSMEQVRVEGNQLLRLIQEAAKGDSMRVRELITAGAPVNQVCPWIILMEDYEGFTALSKAAANGHVECIRELITAKAEVNSQNYDGDTALMKAAMYGHLECIRLLLIAGAQVNQDNEVGRTALLRAANEGHLECVRELIAAGAQVNLADPDGTTPLMEAACNDHLAYVRATHRCWSSGKSRR